MFFTITQVKTYITTIYGFHNILRGQFFEIIAMISGTNNINLVQVQLNTTQKNNKGRFHAFMHVAAIIRLLSYK